MVIPSEVTSPRWVAAAAQRNQPWAPALASALLSGTTTILFYAYSRLHWRVLSRYYGELSEPLRKELVTLLRTLEIYRLGALLAVIFAIWVIRHRPHWPGYIALALSLIAVLQALSVQ